MQIECRIHEFSKIKTEDIKLKKIWLNMIKLKTCSTSKTCNKLNMIYHNRKKALLSKK